MTDTSQPTVDPSGIGRTPDGTIQDGQTTTDQPTPESSPTTTPDGKTLLTEETKPSDTGAKPDAGKEGDTASKEDKTGAPNVYEDYKVPEGYTLDPDIKKEADTLFKGMGLSQQQAQSLVDFYTSKTQEAFQQPYKAWTEMTDKWRTDALDHPDLRGKLGPGKEITVRISKALDSLGDPKLVSDFKGLMDLTSAGNHPAFIRVIDKFAQSLTEGTHVAGRAPSPEGQRSPGSTAQPTAAEAMWPNLNRR